MVRSPAVNGEIIPPGSDGEILPPADSFEELRRVYDRQEHPGDYTPAAVAAARRGFEKARREVAPSTIIEAAKAWIEAADRPRYAIRLDQWLAGRCWEKKPPEKRSAAARGRAPGRGGNGHSRNGRKIGSLTEIMARRFAARQST
jgi:hypothetical protein